MKKRVSTLLITILMILINTMMLFILSVENGIGRVSKTMKDSIYPTVQLFFDSLALSSDLRKEGRTAEAASIRAKEEFHYEEIKELIQDERVIGINALVTQNMDSMYAYPDEIWLKGNGYENMIEIVDNTYSLKEGRFLSEEDIRDFSYVCLISNALAKAENLEVNDQFIASPNLMLRIIGIYSQDEQTPYDMETEETMRREIVLVPATVLQLFINEEQNANMRKDVERGFMSVSEYEKLKWDTDHDVIWQKCQMADLFLLDSAESLEPFVRDHSSLLEASPYRSFQINESEYRKITDPLDFLDKSAGIVAISVCILSAVLILLVALMKTQMEQYEMGLRMLVGESRFRIILSYLFFWTLVLFLSLIPAILCTKAVNRVAEEKIRETLILNAARNSGNTDDMWSVTAKGYERYFRKVDPVSVFERFTLEMDTAVWKTVLIGEFLILLFSQILSTVSVLKNTPKRLLSMRE